MNNQRLAFDEPQGIVQHYIFHLLPLLPLAAILAFGFGVGAFPILAMLAAAIFIDADHLLDYVLEVPFKEWKWRAALRGDHFPSASHAYVLFHGYDEAVVFGWMSGEIWGAAIGWSIAIGLIFHIAKDQLDYSGHPLRYVLLFRALRGFPNDIFVHSQNCRD
ncbi:MAG: hypothetical protein AB1656_19665 [Candidatus Omnitrophota bacterium]